MKIEPQEAIYTSKITGAKQKVTVCKKSYFDVWEVYKYGTTNDIWYWEDELKFLK